MKKTPILSTILALAMLLSLLTGCGGETPSVPSASIESTTESAAVSESSAPEPVARKRRKKSPHSPPWKAVKRNPAAGASPGYPSSDSGP